jgi:hypothetical protein
VRDFIANNPNAIDMCLTPYKEYMYTNRGTGARERVISDMMSADRMNEEFRKVQEQHIEGCDLPRVIFGLGGWSDATKPAQFGSQTLWPMYMCPVNLPNQIRASPATNCWFDIAYLPKV